MPVVQAKRTEFTDQSFEHISEDSLSRQLLRHCSTSVSISRRLAGISAKLGRV